MPRNFALSDNEESEDDEEMQNCESECEETLDNFSILNTGEEDLIHEELKNYQPSEVWNVDLTVSDNNHSSQNQPEILTDEQIISITEINSIQESTSETTSIPSLEIEMNRPSTSATILNERTSPAPNIRTRSAKRKAAIDSIVPEALKHRKPVSKRITLKKFQ